jgi:hypothetical protein
MGDDPVHVPQLKQAATSAAPNLRRSATVCRPGAGVAKLRRA